MTAMRKNAVIELHTIVLYMFLRQVTDLCLDIQDWETTTPEKLPHDDWKKEKNNEVEDAPEKPKSSAGGVKMKSTLPVNCRKSTTGNYDKSPDTTSYGLTSPLARHSPKHNVVTDKKMCAPARRTHIRY
jgi:hypothetical protein